MKHLSAIHGRLTRHHGDDAGMATAEYAMGTVAAAGLGGILYKLLTSDFVMELIKSLIAKALEFIL